MAKSRDGATATYLGPDDQGARVSVLSDEGPYCHVKFITGATEGEIRMVALSTLAFDHPDRPPSPFADDEFGFEYAPRLVSVAVATVYDKGGLSAVMASLAHTAHLGTLRGVVADSLETLRVAVASDPVWAEISSDIGADGPRVIEAIVNELVGEVIGGTHGSVG